MSTNILTPRLDEHVAALPIIRVAGEGRLTREHMRRWLAAEYQCQNAEIAAFSAMGARFVGDDRIVGFVLEVARTLVSGRAAMDKAAGAAGLTRAEMGAWLLPGVHEFTGLVSWLALHGTPAEVAAVVHDDWLLYCAACAELGRVLVEGDGKYSENEPLPADVLDYLRAYSNPPRQIIDEAAALVKAALAETGDVASISRSLPLVEPTLNAFWRAVADV